MISATLFALGLFVGQIALLEIGRRVGRRRQAQDVEGARTGIGAVEGAVFGVLGLLIAFTFSGAASRFDQRRMLIGEEANAISTAYLRLDLLPPAVRGPLKQKFRDYLDARLSAYRKLPDVDAATGDLNRSHTLRAEIWRDAVAAVSLPDALPMAVLPPINNMIDIATNRWVAFQTHPPLVIFAMLSGIALVSALLAGYAMSGAKTRHRLHMLVYATVVSAAVYVIVDLEYPRFGLIRVDAADQFLVDVRDRMK